MQVYSNSTDAIVNLHKRGFTNDFQLVGNDLLWVQEGLLVRVGEFAVAECHKIKEAKNAMNESVVFGIIALYHNVKGILISRHKSYSNWMLPVLIKKLVELNTLDTTNRGK